MIKSLEAQIGDSEVNKLQTALYIPNEVSQTFGHPFLKVNVNSDTLFRP